MTTLQRLSGRARRAEQRQRQRRDYCSAATVPVTTTQPYAANMTTTVGLLSPLLPPSAVTAAVAEEHQQQDYYYVPQPQPTRVVRMKMWSDDDDENAYCADDSSTVSIRLSLLFSLFYYRWVTSFCCPRFVKVWTWLIFSYLTIIKARARRRRASMVSVWRRGDSKFPPTVVNAAAAGLRTDRVAATTRGSRASMCAR